jgi:chromosome partitioning protein
LALQGVGKLLETVHLVSRRMNPGLKVAGIVLTMFDSQTKLSAEVVNDLNSFIESAKGKALPWANARIFRSKIRRNIKLAESPSFGKTILSYDGASNGAADYRSLAKEILGMEGTAVAPGAVKMEGAGVVKTEHPTSNVQRSTSNERPAAAAPAPAVPPVAAAPVGAEAQAGGATKSKPKVAVLVSPEEAAKLKAANKVPEVANNPG